jgi:hypothetical protein
MRREPGTGRRQVTADGNNLTAAIQRHEVNATMRALKKMWEERGDGTPFPGDIHGLPEP